MSFWKKAGRIASGVATGGLSEFARKDPWGVPNGSQYLPIVGGTALGALFGNPLIGAQMGMGMFSAQQAAQNQAEANAQNIAMSREQMMFQERMSSTAHQREVEDLKAAGLNPLLSANSGASSPSGSMATSMAIPSVGEKTLTSAMDAMRFRNESKIMKETARKAGAEAGLAEIEHEYAKKEPDRYFASKFGQNTFTSSVLDMFRRITHPKNRSFHEKDDRRSMILLP